MPEFTVTVLETITRTRVKTFRADTADEARDDARRETWDGWEEDTVLTDAYISDVQAEAAP